MSMLVMGGPRAKESIPLGGKGKLCPSGLVDNGTGIGSGQVVPS